MNKKVYMQSEQKRIIDLVTNKFQDYYLTGGTALAFYFKHRFSEDLDFFSQKYAKADPFSLLAAQAFIFSFHRNSLRVFYPTSVALN